MSDILLLVSRSGNRRVLEEWIAAETVHEPVVPSGEGTLGPDADLCVIDKAALFEYAEAVQARKRAEEPVFLPVLLLISREEAFHLSADVWDAVDDVAFQSMDESIATPIAKFELRGRLRALLNLRETTERLAESRRRYKSLTDGVLDAADVATVVFDGAGDVAWLNRASAEYFGLDRDAVEGTSEREFHERLAVCFEDSEAYLAASAPDTTAADTETYEGRVTAGPDRQARWMSFWRQPIETGLFAGGRVEYYSDVTRLKEREQTLARYEQIIENSNDIAVVFDEDGSITFVNDRLVERTPLSRADIESGGLTVLLAADVFAQTHVERLRDRIDQLLAGDRPEATVEVTLQLDGEDRIVEFRLAPIDLAGGVAGVLGIGRDITERTRREQQLRRFENAVTQAASAIYFTDADGRIEYVNPRFESLTGYAEADVVGETPQALTAEETAEDYYQRLFSTVQPGESHTEEVRNRRATGERYTALQTVAPITDETGALEGYVAIQNDVTEQRRERQRLQVLHRMFRHNLRNDLNVILSRIEWAVDGDPAAAEESLAVARSTIDRITDLIEKTQLVERVLSRSDGEPAVHPLADLLSGLRAQVTERYPEAEVVVEPPAEPTLVDAAVQHALAELLENAIVHNDSETPAVEVRATADGDDCRIEVRDNGPPIPDIERAAIERDTETPLQHSTGIGLWLVKWILDDIGGRVDIEDRQADGTIVSVELPIREESADERPPRARAEGDPPP